MSKDLIMRIRVVAALVLASCLHIQAAPARLSHTIYLPAVATEDGWEKTILLVNGASTAVSATATAFNSYGVSLGQIERIGEIPANQLKTIDSEALPRGTAALRFESGAVLAVY